MKKLHSLSVHIKISHVLLRTFVGQKCVIDVSFHYQNDEGHWRSRSYDIISPASQIRLFALLDGKKSSDIGAWHDRFGHQTVEINFEDISV